MKILEDNTFQDCENLKSVKIPNNVERIGKSCFRNSGIEEITFPSTLKEMHESTFNGCKNLKTVRVEEGCAVGIRKHVSDLVKIIPMRPEITYTKRPDFRRLKDVAIPEGIEKIEELWFAGREVESVMIPASVREIQAGAFSSCRNLANVIFT